MKNENVIKMARLMVGCTDRTCEDCLSQSKKLFGDNKCELIEYAEVLDNADYRKQEDTVKEFIEKVKAKLQKHRETLIYPETEEDEAYDQGCNYGLDLAIEEMQNIAKLFYNDGDYNACEMQAKNKEEDNQ